MVGRLRPSSTWCRRCDACPTWRALYVGAKKMADDLVEHMPGQARITTVLADASGLYIVRRLNAWSWIDSPDTRRPPLC